MKTMVILAMSCLALAACGGANGPTQEEIAMRQSKQLECVKSANITGNFTMETIISSGSVVDRVLPGEDVTEAQAAKANACLANDAG